jgi:hypothetical protein
VGRRRRSICRRVSLRILVQSMPTICSETIGVGCYRSNARASQVSQTAGALSILFFVFFFFFFFFCFFCFVLFCFVVFCFVCSFGFVSFSPLC